jgi:hypothetical protein
MLVHLGDKLQCVLVASAGNADQLEYANLAVPALWYFNGALPNLVVVGAASKHGIRAHLSVPWYDKENDEVHDEGMIYAPGLYLYRDGIEFLHGTSMGQSLAFVPCILL